MFGGRYGNGVLTVRDASSGRFSNPIFITLAGGSVGWQVGATSTDVVLVFVTPRSVENFARGKFTLGADASVAAGPVGRQGEAAAGINAEIYSYSRSRGLFAGVALDGTVIAFDSQRQSMSSTTAMRSPPRMITGGKVTSNSESTRRFLASVSSSANGTGSPAGGTPEPAAPAPAAAAPAPAPANSGGVKTYPMEDANPGTEPK